VWAAIVIAEQAETDHLPYQGNRVHHRANAFARNPRATGLACGLTSVALGLAYLKIADAPFHYIIVNLSATVIGVGCFIATNNFAKHPAQMGPPVWLGSAALLIGTASFGLHVEGASRWLGVGAVTLQPSLILVPVMLVAYSQRRGLVAAVSIILVAIALALQPDRAMAAVLASGAILLAAKVHDRRASTVALCAMAGLGITMYRADTLPAVPHVDRILFTAFDVNVLTGCAVILGAGLLLLPALLARSSNSHHTDAYAVFGAIWITIVAAAAIGNYPTPVVGYGGSAIVGYFLSIAFLPTPLASVGVAESAAIYNRDERDDKSELLENLRDRLVAVGGGYEFHIRADHKVLVSCNDR
jgi:cell division protein FtsW (lipid II flippase)